MTVERFAVRLATKNRRFLAPVRIMMPAGELAVISNGRSAAYLAAVEFNFGGVRGNHVHRRARQQLYVLSGRLLAVFQSLTSGRRFQTTIQAGELVTIAPGYAHAFRGLRKTWALEMNDRRFDPRDTRPYLLLPS